MKTVMLKTSIKNTSGQDMLFRWIAPRGQYLKAGEEIIVDGAYPTAVQNRRFVSSCEYDILNGRVEVQLVTNLQTKCPTEHLVKDQVPAVEEKVELQEQKPVTGALGKKDERWQQGTIEGSKPKPITLPGHEQTLADAEAMANPDAKDADGQPKTLEIFPGGTDLGESKRIEDETAQAASTEIEAPAEAESTENEEAPTEDAPKKRSRKKATAK